MTGRGVPRLSRWLLSLVLPARDREPALGDLEEEFTQISAERGPRAARRWYRAQLRSALIPSARVRLTSAARGLFEVARPSGVTTALHHAVRLLGRRRRLVVASVVTLSLGLGFATSVFTVVYEVVLRPLPYPEADRLVQVWNTYESWRGHEVLDPFWDGVAISYPEFQDLRGEASPFEAVGIYAEVWLPVTGLGEPRELAVGVASASLFELLGVEPILGRIFTRDEEGPARARVALLTHETWQGVYGGSRDVVGRTLTLQDEPFTIVGVLPAGFRLRTINFPARTAQLAWVPVGALGEDLGRGDHSYEGLARLAAGTDLATATARVGAILANGASPDQRGARLTIRKAEESGSAREPLILLTAGVGLLLLIACGNFATLLIGEAVKRRGELATRFALGAGRGSIVRQLALESTVLGTVGGVAAYPVTVLATSGLLKLAPDPMLLPASVAPSPAVLLLGVCLGASSGAVFGLAPALSIRRRNLQSHLRSGVRGLSAERGSVRQGVLAGQVALSLVLLAVASLLVRSAAALGHIEVGYEAAGLWRARVLVSSGSRSAQEARSTYREIVDALRGVPGIEEASLVSAMPFSGRGGSSSFDIVGRETPDSEKSPEAIRRTVLPGYHEMLGIPLLGGRYLNESDRTFASPVVVVSAAMADRYWPGGSAVGARILRDRREFEVVGVVGDVRHGDLREEMQPTMYVPLDVAESPFGMSVVARSELPAESVVAALREVVRAVDPRVPVEDVRSAESLIAASTQQERFRAALLAAFAVLATISCVVGVFANTVRIVAARERELGIRLALGAGRSGLVGSVLREESAWMLTGLVSGALGALLAGRTLAAVLVGVTPFDPLSLSLSVAGLAVAASAAVAHAARRGTALDPVTAMRAE